MPDEMEGNTVTMTWVAEAEVIPGPETLARLEAEAKEQENQP